MFNIHGRLFLALKKGRMVKIIPPQVFYHIILFLNQFKISFAEIERLPIQFFLHWEKFYMHLTNYLGALSQHWLVSSYFWQSYSDKLDYCYLENGELCKMLFLDPGCLYKIKIARVLEQIHEGHHNFSSKTRLIFIYRHILTMIRQIGFKRIIWNSTNHILI